ncbi:MAG: glucose 1-dehydrogenase [Microscillaceae bacterium]|nr:glucose 1-dehydrogenase [Microscillaceae bacterium]
MNLLERFRLDGQVAIITGASKGIGEAIARGLAQAGAKVVVSSRKQEAVEEVADALRQEGLEATGIAAHNGDAVQLQLLVDKTLETYGRIDIIVNNAATNPAFGPVVNTEDSAFDKIMEVNLKGMFMLGKIAYPELKKNKGRVINISSIAGIRPDPRTGIYSVSKAAAISMTQVMARDWGRDGIRVNAICPGLVKTKMSEALWKNEGIYNMVLQNIPLHRMAEPEEMAGLALFLASEASSYCTGASFVADGGMII